MKRILAFLLLFTIPLPGCLWDSDTIREELASRIDSVKILVGWFNRYPPIYYEDRLNRVTAQLKTEPTQASLYDDAAVACDRLGRPTEAIAWMEKKQQFAKTEQTAAGEPSTRYKTLANLGTFYAHRWIKATKSGQNPDKSDLEKAIELVSLAIQENPEAHFNREKYQLLLLQWLNGEENILTEMAQNHHKVISLNFEELGYKDMGEGLLGLVRLGAAWRSPDIFYFLQCYYESQQLGHPRLIANLRVAELLADGQNFLSSEITPMFHDPAELSSPSGATNLRGPLVESTLQFYEQARLATEQREAALTNYVETNISHGRHPDTVDDFWKEWQEPQFLSLPLTTYPQGDIGLKILMTLFQATLIPIAVVAIVIAMRRFRKSAA